MSRWHGGCCQGSVSVNRTNVMVNNSYARWNGARSSSTGADAGSRQRAQVGNTTVARGADNNVYAGRDGNVYRHQSDGQWQQYEGRGEGSGGWSNVDKTQASLDRQHQARQAGDAQAQQFRQSGGGYQGGGAQRAAGARAGGGRRR